MQPIMLKGHERPITMVKYNRDGDLIITCAKDTIPNLWRADTGERIGTFHGHGGAVRACDISFDSSRLLTAAADNKVILWEMESGREIFSFQHPAPVLSCSLAEGDKQFASCTNKFMTIPAQIFIWNIAANEDEMSPLPILNINISDAQVHGVRWTSLNKKVLAYDAGGSISFYNPDNGELLESHQVHKKQIKDVQFNREKTLLISASVDMNAVVSDASTMKEVKRFETDRPVNAAAFSPIKEHVFMGGGQDAQSVTTTSGKSGKFETRMFHLVYQEEFGRVKGHFGPINTLAICPDGRSFVSGGEDGYCRLHHLDQEYFDFYKEEDEADRVAEAKKK